MQKKKISGYFRAKKMVDNGTNIRQACADSGISAMTYYKYKDMFGEQVAENQYEVLPQDKDKEETVEVSNNAPVYKSDLERIQAENAALQEQLKLRAELSKYVQ